MSAFPWHSRFRVSETIGSITHVLPWHAAQWHAHGVIWRGALPAAPFCGALPACAGACYRCVARRQLLHFGAFPQKLATGEFLCDTAQTRRCIVPRDAGSVAAPLLRVQVHIIKRFHISPAPSSPSCPPQPPSSAALRPAIFKRAQFLSLALCQVCAGAAMTS
jgi:hypothetical protein